MTLIEIVNKTVTEGPMLLRYRANSHKETGTAQYDCKPIFTGRKSGWTMLDSMTASMLLSVYKALSEVHQAKYNNIPLGKLVDLGRRHVK